MTESLRGLTENCAAVGTALGFCVRSEKLSPCPACGADRRSRSDPRPPVNLFDEGRAWHCFSCDRGGSALALAALATTGKAKPSSWKEVRERCDSLGLLHDVPSPQPKPKPKPKRPPPDEVRALWRSCRPVGVDHGACAWLRSRRLDVAKIEDIDLARALPDHELPRWASFRGQSWQESGHTLVVPMFDDKAALCSLSARRVNEGDTPKSLFPTGFEVRGLVMADGLARQILERGSQPSWWDSETPITVVIVEGIPDFFTACSFYSEADEFAPAVIGVVAGSWSHDSEIAARIPRGAVVRARMDADEAGERFEHRIAHSLAGRCDVLA